MEINELAVYTAYLTRAQKRANRWLRSKRGNEKHPPRHIAEMMEFLDRLTNGGNLGETLERRADLDTYREYTVPTKAGEA